MYKLCNDIKTIQLKWDQNAHKISPHWWYFHAMIDIIWYDNHFPFSSYWPHENENFLLPHLLIKQRNIIFNMGK